MATVLVHAKHVCHHRKVWGTELLYDSARVFMLEHSDQLIYVYDVNGASLDVVPLCCAQAQVGQP